MLAMGWFGMGETPAPAPDADPPPAAPVEAWAPLNDEERELQELHQMLGKKEGALPRGTFVKMKVAHENRQKADEVRAERQAVEALLEQRARDTTERIQAHRLATKDKDTEAYEEMQRQKARNATRMRLQRQEDLQRREEERQRELDMLRGRTLVARALDEKLDAAEALQDALEQQEQRELTALREAALHATREKTRQRKAELALQSREAHERSLKAQAASDDAKRAQADALRVEKAQQQGLRDSNERARLNRAKEIRRQQEEARERGKQRRQAQLDDRISQAVLGQKNLDDVAERERLRIHARNTRLAKKSYDHRFVDPTDAQRFLVAEYSWLHANLNHEREGGVLAQRNAEHRKILSTTKSRTDNDVSDDAVGQSRIEAAAAAAARKADEAARLKRENAEMRRSLKNVKAITDNDVLDDMVGGQSVAAARDARAQKSAEARTKLARESAERMGQLKAMRKNIIARTDNNLLDDVVNGQSVAAVRDARAQKSAEAQAQLARDSAERMGQLKAMRKNTAARTDNNLLDDVLDGQSVAAARATRAKGGADGRAKLARDNSQRAGQLSQMKRDATTDYVARGHIVPPPALLGTGEPPAGAPAEPEKKKGFFGF